MSTKKTLSGQDAIPAAAVEPEQSREEQEQQAAELAEQGELIRRRRLLDSGIPPRYLGKSLANFETGSRAGANAKLLKEVKGYAQAYITGFSLDGEQKGLFISGHTGCGKSHVAAAILKEVIAKGFTGFWINTTDLLTTIYDQASFYGPRDELDYYETRAASCDLLVLDDLGAEAPRGLALERLYNLVNRRYERNLPIIVTSNHDLLELGERFKDQNRLLSRLGEICARFAAFPNRDYRLKDFSQTKSKS